MDDWQREEAKQLAAREARELEADSIAAALTDPAATIRDILNRGNDVRDWPKDERELHRGWMGDFTSRHAAVIELRVNKILSILDNA